MARKCKTCSKSASVYGFEDAPYMEIAYVTAGAYATSYVEKFLTTNADGTSKTEGMLVEQPMLRKGLFVAGGVGLSAFVQGDVYKNLGVGMATYGLYGLVEELMKPKDQTTSVTGLKFVPPQNIAGLRTLTGNYGIAPSIVAGQHVGYHGAEHRANGMHDYSEEMFAEKQEVSGLVRAL
jgi:hypothetical protein